jgi:hypothetical protein
MPHGASGRASLPITVGNTVPEVRFSSTAGPATFSFQETTCSRTPSMSSDAEDGTSQQLTTNSWTPACSSNARWSRRGRKGSRRRSRPGADEAERLLQLPRRRHASIVGPPLPGGGRQVPGPGRRPRSHERASGYSERFSSKVWGEVPMLAHPNRSPGTRCSSWCAGCIALEPGKSRSRARARSPRTIWRPPRTTSSAALIARGQLHRCAAMRAGRIP